MLYTSKLKGMNAQEEIEEVAKTIDIVQSEKGDQYESEYMQHVNSVSIFFSDSYPTFTNKWQKEGVESKYFYCS